LAIVVSVCAEAFIAKNKMQMQIMIDGLMCCIDVDIIRLLIM
jgi:hypothetical protein